MHKPRRTIHDLIEQARSRYERMQPTEAHKATLNGALLIDIRTAGQRKRDGEIPGAVAIDRNVLEWRVDPDSGATHPLIRGLETPTILLCAEGFSSSLAAGALTELGATQVSDVVGGFEAWRAAGLPIARPQEEESLDC